MTGDAEERTIRERLAQLRQNHRDLDLMIAELESADAKDQLAVSRLKRQKLKLKDEILVLESQLHPDIIA